MKRILFLFLTMAVSSYGFQDLDYLYQKYKIRKTINTLESLKKLYPEYSTPYIKIQKLENYFMKNMPVSAYSTYVRIKLHNIIDNRLEDIKLKKLKLKNQNTILTANTNLNYLYEKKLKEEKEIEKQKEINNQKLGKNQKKQNLFQPNQMLNQQNFQAIQQILDKEQ